MATSSFDKEFIITDENTINKLIEALENTEPLEIKRKPVGKEMSTEKLKRMINGKGQLHMEKLNTIQKRNNLNDIYAVDEKGNGGAHHEYVICKKDEEEIIGEVSFQHGARHEDGSTHGVATADLLEICRNQMACFQSGEMATREGAIALTHIEEALLWLNKRSEDRAERNVLGTMDK